MRNDTIAVRLDAGAAGIIRQIVDVASGRNFVVQAAKPLPLYTLQLTDKRGKRTAVSSTQSQSGSGQTRQDGG